MGKSKIDGESKKPFDHGLDISRNKVKLLVILKCKTTLKIVNKHGVGWLVAVPGKG